MLLAELAVRLVNLVAPKQCAVCGCRLAVGEDVWCSSCNIDLPRTNYSEKPYDNEMARMFWGRMPVEKAAALFFYRAHSPSSRIVYSLKYLGHPEVGEAMGRLIAAEFTPGGFFSGIDFIVPVPLSRARRRSRGYNQSEEIARGISGVTGIPVLPKVLKRKSFSGSQTSLNRWQRNDNVADVFELRDCSRIPGKHVLIVDDVVTTGATVVSCAGELQKCGCEKFSVLSIGFTKS